MKFATKLIHAGELHPRVCGAVNLPIFQTSNYEIDSESAYHDVLYARLNNTPNHAVLHAKLAALEGAEASVVTASGMAAISTTLLALLKPGDHMLIQRALYGGTHSFVSHDLQALGIGATFFDLDDPLSWSQSLTPKTKLIYVETLSNPTLQIPEMSAVTGFAKQHKLISVVDNTLASPYNFRPAEHGFDLSVHSATKYLAGHSDVCAGAVIGRADLVDQIRRKLNLLGATLDPHACFLLHRGIKTLALRMRQHNDSAFQLAERLAQHPRVKKVFYPTVAEHPHTKRAKRTLAGCGGLLSIELETAAQAVAFVGGLKYFVQAASLGGVESLVTRPATTSHASLTPLQRQDMQISDALVRLSIGIEDADDLWDDLQAALAAT